MSERLQAKSELEVEEAPWLERKIIGGITPALLFLTLIIFISLGIHLHNLDAIGDANTYYTAAVEAMLDSWSNFFFVAAEPGGSVTIDKPPLGLWIETAFAYVFGVNGIAVSMPNILAGLLSIPLLYYLLRKYLGAGPGLVAAAVMAFTPVVFAADRNNTMDSMLVFTLLLAAWAFMAAVEKEKLRYLLLGGFIIALGFNIKMMQVLLPVPAFFALYFLASKAGWLRKVLNLGLTSGVILVVSLSWAMAVDAVPEDMRPYIGSSTDNTVMELIVGHNGLNRLFGGERSRQAAASASQDAGHQVGLQDDGQQRPPVQQGQAVPPADANQFPGQRPNAGVQNDGQMQNVQAQPSGNRDGGAFNDEIGSPGVWRFFESQLANEASWMLPFALAAILVGIFSAKIELPLKAGTHKALVLWGGWLVTCLVFFSVAAFFHAYYLVMLAPALGGSVAIVWGVLDNWRKEKSWLTGLVLIALGVLTLGVQITMVGLYQVSGWYIWFAVVLAGMGILLVFAGMKFQQLMSVGMWTILASLLVIPLVWSFLTVDIEQPNINLPSAYAGVDDRRNIVSDNPAVGGQGNNNYRSRMIEFLLEKQTGKYLLAVPSSNQGSDIVLATGEPVLYMGGFNGGDPVVDADDLAELVATGDLTYVLYGGTNNRAQNGGINQWLETSCSVMPVFSQSTRQARQTGVVGGRDDNALTLYECVP